MRPAGSTYHTPGIASHAGWRPSPISKFANRGRVSANLSPTVQKFLSMFGGYKAYVTAVSLAASSSILSSFFINNRVAKRFSRWTRRRYRCSLREPAAKPDSDRIGLCSLDSASLTSEASLDPACGSRTHRGWAQLPALAPGKTVQQCLLRCCNLVHPWIDDKILRFHAAPSGNF